MPARGHRFATILVTICSLGLAQRTVALRNESGRRMFRAGRGGGAAAAGAYCEKMLGPQIQEQRTKEQRTD